MVYSRASQRETPLPFKDDYTTEEREWLIQRWHQIPAEVLNKLFSNGGTHIKSLISQEIVDRLTSIGIETTGIGIDWRGVRIKGPINSSTNEPCLQLCGVRLEFATFDEVDLRRSDMSGAYLRWSQSLSCDISDSNLSDIRAKRVLFERCNLLNGNFSNAKLLGAWFVRSNLEDVQISAAELEQVSFIKTDLRGAQSIEPVNLRNALFDRITANPEDIERWKVATFEGTAVTLGTIGESTAAEKVLRRKIISWQQEQGLSTYEPLQCYLHADRRLCPLQPTRSASRLFIGMPFDPSFREVYEVGIVPAAQAVGLRPWRADEVLSSAQVLCKVCFEIQQCEFGVST